MKTADEYFKNFYLEVEKYIQGIHILNKGISEKEICSFEETYDICLPYYYREWLKRNNGGELFAVPAGINIAGILGKQEREMGEIYVEDNFDIKKRVPGMPDFLFILADNCLGDVIGFDLMQTNNMDGVVVYWNHETGEITEQWDSLAEWLDSVMESEKMLINYDGSERELFD